jgi:hypothetical protein
VIDDNVFSSGWSGRVNKNVEYVAYNKTSNKIVDVDLSAESGQWRLYEWDAATPGSLPIDHGVQSGGSSVTWDLNFHDSAIQIINLDSIKADPKPPSDVQIQ